MSEGEVLRCYRGVCENAAHPLCYNRETHGLYCEACARLIAGGPHAPAKTLFPFLNLVGDRFVEKSMEGGSLASGSILVRPQ